MPTTAIHPDAPAPESRPTRSIPCELAQSAGRPRPTRLRFSAKKSPASSWRATVTDARRAYIERVIAAAPPLTPEQRDRLALLLKGDRTQNSRAA